MSWGEALRLTAILALDGSSQVGASVGGWEYPASREAQILMDLLDRQGQAHFKDPTRYPRPWPEEKAGTERVGDTGGRTQRQIIEHLNSLGHNLPLPDDDEPEGGDDG